MRPTVTGPAECVRAIGVIGLRATTFVSPPQRQFEVRRRGDIATVNDELLWFVAEHARTRVFVHAWWVSTATRW